MQINRVFTKPKLLHAKEAVQTVQPLLPSVAVPQQLHVGGTLYVPRSVLGGPDLASSASEPPAKTSPTLGHITANLGIGVGLAGAPLKAVQISASTSEVELAQLLTGNQIYNLAPANAEQAARSALEFARSNAGKSVFVFLAATGLALGVLEAFTPESSWPRKLTLAALFGALVVLGYLALLYFGSQP